MRCVRAICCGTVAAVAAGCGGNQLREGDCSVTVTFSGAVYAGQANLPAPPRGERLGEGVRSACPDAEEGSEAIEERRVTVFRVGRLPPALAVRIDGTESLATAQGYIPTLRGHPLHRRIYRSDAKPRPPRGCTEPLRLEATVTAVPTAGGVTVRSLARGKELFVNFHARTRVRGFLRAGYPFLRDGDRLRIIGRRCPRTAGARLVADRIGPAH